MTPRSLGTWGPRPFFFFFPIFLRLFLYALRLPTCSAFAHVYLFIYFFFFGERSVTKTRLVVRRIDFFVKYSKMECFEANGARASILPRVLNILVSPSTSGHLDDTRSATRLLSALFLSANVAEMSSNNGQRRPRSLSACANKLMFAFFFASVFPERGAR